MIVVPETLARSNRKISGLLQPTAVSEYGCHCPAVAEYVFDQATRLVCLRH